MNDSKLKPYADLKYKARTYTDENGKEKGVWVTVGTLFCTPHGSHMSVKLDTVPVGEFNGWLSVFEREDKKQEFTNKDHANTHEFNKRQTSDNIPEDVPENIDLSQIPF